MRRRELGRFPFHDIRNEALIRVSAKMPTAVWAYSNALFRAFGRRSWSMALRDAVLAKIQPRRP